MDRRTGAPASRDEGTMSGDIRVQVMERYARVARGIADGTTIGGCSQHGGCGPGDDRAFGGALYEEADRSRLPAGVVAASLGCGTPTVVADLRTGETVLDLGAGGGMDVLLSARRVGPTGRVVGLDMTDEMLALARRNAADAGIGNAEFVKGHMEDIPLPDASVDVVISNCAVNLSPDKRAVIRETFRVLRPGGRLGITDVVVDEEPEEDTRVDVAWWTGCVAGALTRDEYRRILIDMGFADISIDDTHDIAGGLHGAVVFARKPIGP